VQDGVLHTPTPDCFLDGITRRTAIDLARQRGFEVVERAILPDELAKTDEVFITGTAAEVTPVGEIGSYKFKVGPITQALMQDYEDLVRRPPATAASAAE
jgi:branched-chain amino acid aminotransferase